MADARVCTFGGINCRDSNQKIQSDNQHLDDGGFSGENGGKDCENAGKLTRSGAILWQ